MKKIFILGVLFLVGLLCFIQGLCGVLPAGLPEDIIGYKKWTRLNKKLTSNSPLLAAGSPQVFFDKL